MKNSLYQKLKKFNQCNIAVLGDIMLDNFVWGEVHRISPEAPVPVVHVVREENMPGAAANVAVNLAALGVTAQMVSVIGNDFDGKLLKQKLCECGVTCNLLVNDPNRKTTRKTRIIAKAQHVVRVDWDAIFNNNNPKIIQKLLKNLDIAIKNSDAIIIQDYNKGLITEKLIEHANKYGKIVIIDPNRYQTLKYKGTVITPNLEEAICLSGLNISMKEALNKLELISKKIFEKHEIQYVVITLSEHGIALCDKSGNVRKVPAARTHDIYDVSGAGDTVVAVLAAALASDIDIWKACQLANIAGAIVVGKMGTASTTVKEITELIETNESLKKSLNVI